MLRIWTDNAEDLKSFRALDENVHGRARGSTASENLPVVFAVVSQKVRGSARGSFFYFNSTYIPNPVPQGGWQRSNSSGQEGGLSGVGSPAQQFQQCRPHGCIMRLGIEASCGLVGQKGEPEPIYIVGMIFHLHPHSHDRDVGKGEGFTVL